ncbi:Germin [Parasponia andersonii]|uniref:Germin-like protein n=1 Tax=Parasponia andersonii TaxID=3476 RepID=A0A2P5DTF4_PARAD|nr:Germin [Parasponia andersonii]
MFLPNAVFVNGKFCKNPKLVDADDFFASGFNSPGNTNNPFGSNVEVVDVNKIPGLNTLGLSLVRIDYAPNGLNPPHAHPRGSEILAVAAGSLLVSFVSSNNQVDGGNRLFTKVLNQGDVFVFPIGLIHFELNVGRTPAVAFSVLNSQNPGITTIANAIFGSDPPINADILARAFKLDKKIVENLQRKF